MFAIAPAMAAHTKPTKAQHTKQQQQQRQHQRSAEIIGTFYKRPVFRHMCVNTIIIRWRLRRMRETRKQANTPPALHNCWPIGGRFFVRWHQYGGQYVNALRVRDH